MSRLLVITTDGYAKRIALADVPRFGRNAKGVMLSSVSVAAVLRVEGASGDVVTATANGKVERVAVSSVPIRRREVLSRGRLSKGARIIALEPGDRVAAASIPREDIAAEPAPRRVETPSPALGAQKWPGGRVGLREGERADSAIVFHPLRPLGQIEPGGRLAVPADEWAQTDVHRASTYFCAHCGRRHPDPETVYACIDRHAADRRNQQLKEQ